MTEIPDPVPTQRALLILAFDHRNSLEKELYELTAPPTAAEAARISADKLLIYQALLDATAALPAEAVPGALVDEQYGAGVAELASRSSGLINLSMPLEASGEEWFHFAYPDDWRRHADYFATDQAKVLVRDNPGLDPAQRDAQARSLAEVTTWSKGKNKPLILELLVPASDADLAGVGGDKGRYDLEVRPERTLAVIRYLQDHGVEPAIWKVEGLDRHEDAQAVAELARRDGRTARCIVLGRHASHDKLEHWLQIAAPIPGYFGFAIGRSIWWDALVDHLHGRATGDEVRRTISGAYLDYANLYLKARSGSV